MESKDFGPGRRRAALVRTAATLMFVALGIVVAPEILAQDPPAATRLEMRHFWHVFIAYAIAWIILFGWMLSILRRFRRVEESMDAGDGGG